jgi:hypothetical protein
MVEFEIYKGDGGKAFAVFKDLSIPKSEMLKIANNGHFKKKLENLKCVSGCIDQEDNLFLSSKYVEGTQVVWVVTRKD